MLVRIVMGSFLLTMCWLVMVPMIVWNAVLFSKHYQKPYFVKRGIPIAVIYLIAIFIRVGIGCPLYGIMVLFDIKNDLFRIILALSEVISNRLVGCVLVCKLWLQFVHIKKQGECSTLQWKQALNPNYNPFILKYYRLIGRTKNIATYCIVVWLLMAFASAMETVIYGKDSMSISVFWTIVLIISIILCYFDLQFYDLWFIRKENIRIMIVLLVCSVYIAVWLVIFGQSTLFGMFSVSDQSVIRAVTLKFGRLMAFVGCIQVSFKMVIKDNLSAAIAARKTHNKKNKRKQRKQRQKQQKQAAVELDGVSRQQTPEDSINTTTEAEATNTEYSVSTQTGMLRLESVVQEYELYSRFMKHLVAEFNCENLIFCTHILQLQQYCLQNGLFTNNIIDSNNNNNNGSCASNDTSVNLSVSSAVASLYGVNVNVTIPGSNTTTPRSSGNSVVISIDAKLIYGKKINVTDKIPKHPSITVDNNHGINGQLASVSRKIRARSTSHASQPSNDISATSKDAESTNYAKLQTEASGTPAAGVKGNNGVNINGVSMVEKRDIALTNVSKMYQFLYLKFIQRKFAPLEINISYEVALLLKRDYDEIFCDTCGLEVVRGNKTCNGEIVEYPISQEMFDKLWDHLMQAFYEVAKILDPSLKRFERSEMKE